MTLREYSTFGEPATVAPGPFETETFRSILFPSHLENMGVDEASEPICFVDLNLDQIVGSIVENRDEEILRPIFYSAHRSEEIVRYRQAVFADLEQPETYAAFPPFCDAMRSVRADLAYAEQISQKSHRNTVILRAAQTYCEAILSLLWHLQKVDIASIGLQHLRSYIRTYTSSGLFKELARETRDLRTTLANCSYGMLFRGDAVTVRRYGGEPDYTVTILERFARFRETDIKPTEVNPVKNDFSLNHIEAGILEFVSRLFQREFDRLEQYVVHHAGFVDPTIARFDREIGFYVSYLAYIEPLKRAGLPFCLPDISTSSKTSEAVDSFDLALARKLLRERGTIVCNDFNLDGAERLIVVSGPNQGGKTTFARMFGQLHFLASLGCPVPGRRARLFLPDRIFTHFEREEDISNLRGKLEDELVRLHQTCEAMTGESVVILNEIFNSTSLDDQIFLSTNILKMILSTDAVGVCVTFIDRLSRLGEQTVSMVSTIDKKDPAHRTFKIVRKAADGLAYALSLAQKRGVTYEQLKGRILP